MKNFSKLLALGVALSLTFGMTAFANEEIVYSRSTKDPAINDTVLEKNAEALNKDNAGVTITAVNAMWYDYFAEENGTNPFFADDATKALDVEEVKSVELVKGAVFDIPDKTGEITLNVSALEVQLESGATYVMLHRLDNGKFEVLPVTVNSATSITFTIGSNSMFALYKVDATAKDTGSNDDGDDDNDDTPAVNADGAPASPKTGETLPMAGIVMMIALAGAAVCATKVRYNN